MLSKSIDFLLEYAGPVIKYRLKKEILKDITKTEEENLLEQIYEMPYFKLLQTYVKPDGFIGNGMHSWDNWKGQKSCSMLRFYTTIQSVSSGCTRFCFLSASVDRNCNAWRG